MHIRTIFIHAAIWVAWWLSQTYWAFFQPQKQPFWPVAYNLASLTAPFYGCRCVASCYWGKMARYLENSMWVDGGRLVVKYPGTWRFYVCKWPVPVMLAAVIGYIGLSWMVDGYFIASGQKPPHPAGFTWYMHVRWVGASVYIVGGNVMAAIQYHVRKTRQEKAVLEQGTAELQKLNDVYETVYRD